MYAFYNEVSVPQRDDIKGARYLYGPNAPSVIPIPATLPLFLTAIAVLGTASMKRKWA